MKALVTGASGFVGSHLCEHLRSAGDTVVATDMKTLDVSNRDAVAAALREHKPDAVYHLAGIPTVAEVRADLARAKAINVDAPALVAEEADKLGKPVIAVFLSSAEVYGNSANDFDPIPETAPQKPANPYAESKRDCEKKLTALKLANVKTLILRPFNQIGPNQTTRFVVPAFAEQLAKIAAGKTGPVVKVGNLGPLRDFIDVRDSVRAYRLAVVKGQSGIWNVGSGVARSVHDVLDALIRNFGTRVEIETDPAKTRPAEVPSVRASIEKAERDLGWKPEIAFEKTIRDICDEWRKKV